MNKILAAALLAAFVATPAFAATAKSAKTTAAKAAPAAAAESPYYVGGTYGSISGGGSSQGMMGGFAGYRLSKSLIPSLPNEASLAVEGVYEIPSSAPAGYTSSTMGVLAVGKWKLDSVNKQLSAFGKLGYLSTSYTSTYTGPTGYSLATGITYGTTTISGSNSGLSFGFGADYTISTQFTARAGYQIYPTPSGSSVTVSAMYASLLYNL